MFRRSEAVSARNEVAIPCDVGGVDDSKPPERGGAAETLVTLANDAPVTPERRCPRTILVRNFFDHEWPILKIEIPFL